MTTPKETKTEIRTIPDSKYRLILVAAARSKQIQKGREPRVRSANHKPTRIALEEVSQGLVPFEVLPPRESTIPHHEDGIISI
ncbi:MAG: DNA-directed RNA polymerase subunit omega [Chloracidobacterium sp.]|uniref:DNA-directed RNA polymerase subunit omega n=1 Tax=Chloracidobacterium validum TaxID=2821543 RepID=A0ABX8B676_9BACT|nr:DNA-directed RNA polymerase subunit omega [Chloracidobacterium validum]QUW02418.1 DNA-directed RNA polymerase subunit omega [Chloracidobacterium validum]